METIKEILMRRDHLSGEEAEEAIERAKREVEQWAESGEGRSPDEILLEDFRLEPDWVYEIIPGHLL